MRAVSMQSRTARDLALVDIPVPEPAPHEVRIKVEAVGICGSDVSMAMHQADEFDALVNGWTFW